MINHAFSVHHMLCYEWIRTTLAKAAFDVVGHTSLYRKLFLLGVRGKLWLLTYHLSQGAETSVKWQGIAMDPFAVSEGVRQAGVLSTDLYQLYINPVITRVFHICIERHYCTLCRL
jgi:hypothetical protein